MIAAVARRYGSPEVISVQELPTPTPTRGQVLVRIRAASLNPLDSKLRTGALRPFLSLRFPAVLGFDLAGEVEGLGPGKVDLARGDRVYGRIDRATGGAHAQYAAVSAAVLDRIPVGLSFQQAAALPLTGMTVLQGLQDIAQLRRGQRLLVVGATGGVGVMAVQIGRAIGGKVTAVCSANGRTLAMRLGASQVLDYAAGDLQSHTDEYDVVFDTVFKQGYGPLARWVRRGGVYVTTGFSPALGLQWLLAPVTSRRRVHWIHSAASGARMRRLSALVVSGQLQAVVDSTFALDQVQEAYHKLEAGHARGKIVVTMP